MSVTMTPDRRRVLELLHAQSDWVIAVDRFFSPDFYDAPLDAHLGPEARQYLLDYRPDFGEGLGHRLIVTTSGQDEIMGRLHGALGELGLDASADTVTALLDHLKMASGRLAYRGLQSEAAAAQTAALAAVLAYLQGQGRLRQAFLVPIGLHTDLLGGGAAEEHCDALLVTLRRNVMDVTFVAARRYRGDADIEDLADEIEARLERTRLGFQRRYFDDMRVDNALQRAHLAAVLRFYLERAVRHGLLDGRVEGWFREHLARLERVSLEYRATSQGFILAQSAGVRAPDPRGDVTFEVVRPADLHRATPFTQATPLEPALPFDQDAAASISSSGVRDVSADSGAGAGHPDALVEEHIRPSADEERAAETVGLVAAPSAIDDASEAEKSAPTTFTDPTDADAATGRPVPLAPPAPAASSVPAPNLSEATSSIGLGVANVPDLVEDETSSSSVVSHTDAVPVSDEGNRPEETGAETVSVLVGHAGTQATPVIWEPGVRGTPHLFVVGTPGQGKSWTVARAVGELTRQGVPSLLLDFHGQFGGHDGRLAVARQATVWDARDGLPFSPFELPDVGVDLFEAQSSAQAIAEIFGYVCKLGPIQRDVVYRAVSAAFRARGVGNDAATGSRRNPTSAEVLKQIERYEGTGSASNVSSRCRPLLEMGLFRPRDGDAYENLLTIVRHGLVIDLHRLAELEILQLAAGAFILRKLYKDMFTWGEARALRLLVVLDEAHRLANDVTLPKLMKEGRKFGIAVIVASQGMADFHKDVPANAGTRIVFRTNHPDSRKVASLLSPQNSGELARRIERLKVGQAYVQAPGASQPALVTMAPPAET